MKMYLFIFLNIFVLKCFAQQPVFYYFEGAANIICKNHKNVQVQIEYEEIPEYFIDCLSKSTEDIAKTSGISTSQVTDAINNCNAFLNEQKIRRKYFSNNFSFFHKSQIQRIQNSTRSRLNNFFLKYPHGIDSTISVLYEKEYSKAKYILVLSKPIVLSDGYFLMYSMSGFWRDTFGFVISLFAYQNGSIVLVKDYCFYCS